MCQVATSHMLGAHAEPEQYVTAITRAACHSQAPRG